MTPAVDRVLPMRGRSKRAQPRVSPSSPLTASASTVARLSARLLCTGITRRGACAPRRPAESALSRQAPVNHRDAPARIDEVGAAGVSCLALTCLTVAAVRAMVPVSHPKVASPSTSHPALEGHPI
jgi:hypothetical protein